MFSLKKFDFHVKAIDGVNQKTLLGAALTIIATFLIVIMIITETRIYINKEKASRMLVDSSNGIEAVDVHYDISFRNCTCEKISLLKEVTKGTVHIHEEEFLEKVPFKRDSDGCWMKGHFTTDKIGGIFKFKIDGGSVDTEVDLSHKVNILTFVPVIYDHKDTVKVQPELGSFHDEITNVPLDIGLYQYGLIVVPEEYRSLDGKKYEGNKYSINERSVERSKLITGITLSSQVYKNFTGVVFTYEFSPVILVTEERRESVYDFLANICAIAGGMIALFGFFERMIFSTSKVIMGKED